MNGQGTTTKDTQALAKRAQALEIAGRSEDVLRIGRELVKLKPQWAVGHYFMGSGLCGLGLLDEAERSLRKAISRDGKQFGMHTKLGEVLNRLGHAEEARACAEAAIELAPDNADALVPAAMIWWLSGDPARADEILLSAIERGVATPKLINVAALLGGERGRLDESIVMLEELLEAHNDGRGLPRLLHSEIRMYLAKLLDKAGRYDEAFEQARSGGDLRETGYDGDLAVRMCNERLEAWSVERYPGITGSRVKTETPVFVIGMPRSGTSLVEQIIASHPSAYGAGELMDTYHSAKELTEPNELIQSRVELADQLKPAALDRHARKALKNMEKAAKREKGSGVERVTDKLPNNFELVGIISKMFPGARFIHCQRNPLDTCVSCFMLDFVGDRNHGYSYNLNDLANQYRVYQRYMDHWRSIGSIPILDVRYEELIADAEGGARRIIEFIGLGWDDACAQSHKTQRAVSTLSSDQVRKPMYTSSRARWRHYEQHIGVLIEALGTGEAE
ncbi:MAG: tetratricopeptide repeat-containing sulfotransferase family protein [Phycisphaerales bacterium]